MLSNFESSTASPISRLPYDVLHEVFTHCLPTYPLHHPQPDTKIAPILLCHICSSWRTAALMSVSLWTHLSYCLTIVPIDDYDLSSGSWPFNFVAREIEFLQWWRKNHGLIAPFLNFRSDWCSPKSIPQEQVEDPAQGGMDFIFEYIASAQSVELDAFYWHRLLTRIVTEHQDIFPNLHSLIAEYRWVDDDECYSLFALLQNETFPVLRHLAIGGASQDVQPEIFSIPYQWSAHALTHISIHASISLDFWFPFLCATPNLQWAHFDIATLRCSIASPTRRRTCTHLQLTTLSVTVSDCFPSDVAFPLSALFHDLHLPALRSLALSLPNHEIWEDHRGLAELYSVLPSTPGITHLALADDFLSIRTTATTAVLAPMGDVAPVWTHVPRLVHLQLHLGAEIVGFHDVRTAWAVDRFVSNVLLEDGGWLDLWRPACPVRSLALLGEPSPQLEELVMGTVQRYWKSRLDVQITAESAEDLASIMRDNWSARI